MNTIDDDIAKNTEQNIVEVPEELQNRYLIENCLGKRHYRIINYRIITKPTGPVHITGYGSNTVYHLFDPIYICEIELEHESGERFSGKMYIRIYENGFTNCLSSIKNIKSLDNVHIDMNNVSCFIVKFECKDKNEIYECVNEIPFRIYTKDGKRDKDKIILTARNKLTSFIYDILMKEFVNKYCNTKHFCFCTTLNIDYDSRCSNFIETIFSFME